jgi:phosphate transport system substrate-binding protein
MAIRRMKTVLLLALAAGVLALVAAGCGGSSTDSSGTAAEPSTPPVDTGGASAGESLSGTIEADGSSTVGPLTTAAAEEFGKANPDVKITVGISGTGGGFERFCAGETDLSDASRPIKDEEAAVCKQNGIDYTEFHVATDALTVVVNKENTWATCLTVDQLKKIWEPAAEGTITNWNQVDPSFPDQKLVLAGPGTDSGTFDYFTGVINGEEGASRADYTASEDDNVIVQAVGGDKGGMGYFGYSYYEQNQDTLNAVQIDSGSGCVSPSKETAQDGTYTPLARPLFIYAKNESFKRPEVEAFLKYILDNNQSITASALFIPLTDEQLQKAETDFQTALSSVGAG